MEVLNDEFLMEAFKRAIEQELDPLFIEILQNELTRRGISPDFILQVS